MAPRAMVILWAVLTCSGCLREYVHWEPDVSVAARRADSLPDDREARVRSVNRQNFEARDIAFEGERLRWTEPGSGVVSTLPLSQVDTVRVEGERKPEEGRSLVSRSASVGWVCLAWLIPNSPSGT